MIVTLGDAPVTFAAGPGYGPTVGKVLDGTAYLWLGLTVAALVWAVGWSPKATARREAIGRAKARLKKARRLPRVGV